MSTFEVVRLTRHEALEIENAIRFIDEHYDKKVTASLLAQDFSVPIKKLQAGIKQKTGLLPHDYLLAVRLIHAKEMLVDDVPIKKIPSLIGYHSLSHFIQFFRKKTGFTPAEYRAIESNRR